ncbi:MAG TPA: hypothetical protein VNI58_07150, partial [Mariprofundaceae bacterium]|nr:hypothetical protein [Mariprofundaceae bacterium]
DSDRPGFYRLYKSNNDNVCVPLSKLINADIKKYGKTRFDTHSEFATWHKVDQKSIDRGDSGYDGWVQQADVDINNDGIMDQVIRTSWSMGGAMNDSLNVLPENESQKIRIDDLIRSDKKIMFNVNNYWLERYRKKYGDPLLVRWGWYFKGIASLNLLKKTDATYVVAQNYAAPTNVSAKIYVFQLDKDFRPYKERDVCMFLKTCPCKGCVDLRGDEVSKSLPAKKWCQ